MKRIFVLIFSILLVLPNAEAAINRYPLLAKKVEKVEAVAYSEAEIAVNTLEIAAALAKNADAKVSEVAYRAKESTKLSALRAAKEYEITKSYTDKASKLIEQQGRQEPLTLKKYIKNRTQIKEYLIKAKESAKEIKSATFATLENKNEVEKIINTPGYKPTGNKGGGYLEISENIKNDISKLADLARNYEEKAKCAKIKLKAKRYVKKAEECAKTSQEFAEVAKQVLEKSQGLYDEQYVEKIKQNSAEAENSAKTVGYEAKAAKFYLSNKR